MRVVREKVGASHQNAVSELTEAFETVRLICPHDFVSKLDADLEKMLDWRARIAVIGQVKAGKSTLLSALIGKPDFLPSEVNPWTSVVTNLHFGHPTDPQSGGVFRFFDEEAWNKIINGNEETREMAESLLPGFKSEVLEEQVEEMRVRARQRFGQFYEMLLGTEHRYDHVTRETLERYVCAGPERDETTPADKLGRYSDITESADIYLPPGVFASPAILTDTPGVNDPFLVRDEFTCQSLSKSDIFVMTMSAHQALTDVDRGLMKMLAAHSGNQVIIFINRIDELDQLVTQTPKIIDDVRERVSDIIAGHQLSIVAGSAYWAEQALNENPDTDVIKQQANRDDLKEYLAAKNHTNEGDDRVALLRASGMTDLVEAMSFAIESGAGRTMRQQASHSLLTSIDACISVMDGQRKQIQSKLGSSESGASLQEIVRQSLDSQLEAIKEVKEELDVAFSDGQEEVQIVVEDSFASIQRDLDNAVKNFIEENQSTLMKVFEAKKNKENVSLDMLKLQELLEEATLQGYASARERLDASLERLTFRADMIAKPIVGDIGSANMMSNLPNDEVTPVFLSTPRTLTLELTSKRGWKFWKSTQLDKVEAFDRLRRLIRAEIYASVENLASIGNMALIERAAAAIGQSASLWTSAFDSLSAHAADLETQEEALSEGAADPSKKAEMEARLRHSVENLKNNISALEAAKRRIGTLMEQLVEGAAA